LGQHRECAALRGLGWNRNHSTVNYVFDYPYDYLFQYHWLIMIEMIKRGYKVNSLWFVNTYRGKRIGVDKSDFTKPVNKRVIYPEHNDEYLKECIENLNKKGVFI
jgi:uncharacterized protein (TIGR02328 family)